MSEIKQLEMAEQQSKLSPLEFIEILKEWIKYLKSKLVFLLIAFILGGGLGFFYAFLHTTQYVANVTYALEDEKTSGGIGGAMGLASTLGLDLGTGGGGAFAASNLMELMHSRSLIEKTLLTKLLINGKETCLADYYINIYNSNKSKESNGLNEFKYYEIGDRKKFSRTQDSLLGIISETIDINNLSISQKDKKISIGTIEVKSKNELFSKMFCETLVIQVSNYYIETKSKKAKLNVSILEKQTDSIRAELNSAITGVAIANDNIYNLNSAMNVKRAPSSKRQVDVQANTAILTQLVTNLEMAKVALRKETPLIQIIDSPILPLKKETISKTKFFLIGAFISFFALLLIFVSRRMLQKFINQ